MSGDFLLAKLAIFLLRVKTRYIITNGYCITDNNVMSAIFRRFLLVKIAEHILRKTT
uniref:Uncharacterized protein n=1 Tax=viral metagenome TaxID=1070528 RepID=A0A6C0D3W5_9ZZZZ